MMMAHSFVTLKMGKRNSSSHQGNIMLIPFDLAVECKVKDTREFLKFENEKLKFESSLSSLFLVPVSEIQDLHVPRTQYLKFCKQLNKSHFCLWLQSTECC
jgi:hypothetical protein